MSLAKLLGQAGRTYGRGGDDTLVHMSKGEVGALQSLANSSGTSLTINPDTGLPEAFAIAALLPAIAGAGATAAGMSPLLAAGLIGGGTALMSGSLERGLAAGLGAYGGAGIGEGLAGIGSAANAASAAAPSAASMAGAGANAAQAAAMPNLANVTAAPGLDLSATLGGHQMTAPMMASPMSAPPPAPSPNMGMMGRQVLDNPSASFALNQPQPQPQPSFMDRVTGGFGDMGGGLQQLFTAPNEPIGEEGGSALDRMGGIMGLGTNALMASAPMFYQSPEEAEEEEYLDPDRGYIRPYTFHRERIEDAAPGERKFNQYYEEHTPVRPEAYDGVKRFAEGGPAAVMTAQDGWRQDIRRAIEGLGGLDGLQAAKAPHEGKQVMEFQRVAADDGSGRKWDQKYITRDMTPEDIEMGRTAYQPGLEYDAGGNPVTPNMSGRTPGMSPFLGQLAGGGGFTAGAGKHMGGGFTAVGGKPMGGSMYNPAFMGYAEGGMLEGPGDGLSDDIPAVIDGVQPAALSTDEFVIPADVVSALGNGSSDAGAKELYAMMDRIRSKAHGKKKQQSKISPKGVLPV